MEWRKMLLIVLIVAGIIAALPLLTMASAYMVAAGFGLLAFLIKNVAGLLLVLVCFGLYKKIKGGGD